MITLKVVQPDSVSFIWPKVYDRIERALDYCHGENDLDSVLIDLRRGAARLLLVEENGLILAAIVLTVVDYPCKKVLNIALAGGEKMDKWYKDVIECAERLAKEFDLDAVYVAGRRGWERQLAGL